MKKANKSPCVVGFRGMPDGLAIGVTSVEPSTLKRVPEILDGLGKAGAGWRSCKIALLTDVVILTINIWGYHIR